MSDIFDNVQAINDNDFSVWTTYSMFVTSFSGTNEEENAIDR